MFCLVVWEEYIMFVDRLHFTGTAAILILDPRVNEAD
jgi:hypothetical protein